MRMFLIPLAAAAASTAVAAPASAQSYGNLGPVYGAPGYGYGAPVQGYGYNLGHARSLHARVDRIQHEIRRLAQHRMLSPSEFRRLDREARQVERSLVRNARDRRGLDMREAHVLQQRIARLEYRLARDVRDGRRYAYGQGYGWR